MSDGAARPIDRERNPYQAELMDRLNACPDDAARRELVMSRRRR